MDACFVVMLNSTILFTTNITDSIFIRIFLTRIWDINAIIFTASDISAIQIMIWPTVHVTIWPTEMPITRESNFTFTFERIATGVLTLVRKINFCKRCMTINVYTTIAP